MARHPRATLLVFVAHALLLTLCSAELSAQQQQQQQQQQVRDEMNEFVNTVKHAVNEAESASNKKDVVDLGQSLAMLEKKFSSLRSALAQELGAKAPNLASNNAVAKELMDKSTNLVQGVVTQREELRRLSSDVKQVDSAIRALKEGVKKFETEVSDLHRVVADLHVSHNEMSAVHDEAKEKLKEVVADAHHMAQTSTHSLLYILVAAEVAGFVLYLYVKRPASSFAHKAYGKFG
ncbi:hypothetical protein BWQ96_05602 [Gracilariopsis chorda]|uniref:Uncharacterized protein n=1 Tax=Gracilariopsis chorda TaxID=448386 RepID=A0A2V3IU64_9FLOR|nr:hypothetical protein BWQ96_05602 [Gracilariopsis chorda]|eukprot:PXF44660.1 hypothetical protein BWQ96_05602 [Gracilariopsis chorda]